MNFFNPGSKDDSFTFHIGFSLVNVAVVWAILEMISCMDQSYVKTGPRYLNLDTVSTIWRLSLISLLKPLMFHSVGRICFVARSLG